MHAENRARKITGTGGKDKDQVMGILERGGQGPHKGVYETARRKPFRLKYGSMLKPDPPSTAML